MLHELRIENLLLIDRAELRLTPGLNVVTGETGAGKTLLAQSLDLLLGGRAGSGVVRRGAAEAYVEGVFSVPASLSEIELLPDGAEELVLARRVWPDGRTRAYVCGRSATVADLRELGSALLAFYGQHEHRRLMLSAVQLDVLDRHCGAEQAGLLARAAAAHERVRSLEGRVAELREIADGRERELDLLAFELEEIERVSPSEAEAGELAGERERLRHLETLRGSAFAGAEAIAPDGGVGGAAELLAGAAAQLQAAAGIDPRLDELSERIVSLGYEAQDVGAALRSYADGLEGSPGRLEEVEERLGHVRPARAQARRVGRRGARPCGALPAPARGARAGRGLARLLPVRAGRGARGDGRCGARAVRAAPASGAEARRGRARAAGRAGHARRYVLGRAGVPGGRVRAAGSGCRRADDRAEPRDAGRTAAGDRLGRRALAGDAGAAQRGARLGWGRRVGVAVAIAVGADGRGRRRGRRGRRDGGRDGAGPLLVFDEIDAGIGGHTARAVGEHLRVLAAGRQVLCITHLPQVAAMAARHFTIAKDTSATPARTMVSVLDGDGVVGELVRMLGASEGDRGATRHARDLLRAA